MPRLLDNISHYLVLMRVDKPIGSLLLLWPTLWALWIAYAGEPPAHIVWIFVAGVFVMRSAGCVINDYADRDIDGHVDRTKHRPLASGALKPWQALVLFGLLIFFALILLSLLPIRVWPWALPAAVLTVCYPFMKRFFQAPQLVLGLAFSFAIPMVYVTARHSFDTTFFLLFISNLIWVLMFDTAYAMSDREDDLNIGVRSTAILLGKWDRHAIAILQITFLVLWGAIADLQSLSLGVWPALLIVCCLFSYQLHLISKRDRAQCFQAFLNNAWVGATLWFALLVSL